MKQCNHHPIPRWLFSADRFPPPASPGRLQRFRPRSQLIGLHATGQRNAIELGRPGPSSLRAWKALRADRWAAKLGERPHVEIRRWPRFPIPRDAAPSQSNGRRGLPNPSCGPQTGVLSPLLVRHALASRSGSGTSSAGVRGQIIPDYRIARTKPSRR